MSQRHRPRSRPLSTPSTTPRTQLHKTPQPLREVTSHAAGCTRRVITAEGEAEKLESKLLSINDDFPRLDVGPRRGAVDIILEDPVGTHVKFGTVLLESG